MVPCLRRGGSGCRFGLSDPFSDAFCFILQLLQIPLNFSTATDWDGPRLEQHSEIEKL